MPGQFSIASPPSLYTAETGKKAKHVANLPPAKLFRLQSLDCAKTGRNKQVGLRNVCPKYIHVLFHHSMYYIFYCFFFQ